ncbi:MAG: hypothetical protein OXM58_15685 [Rhodospirillaceae bacterium]|nr:hypothetical protein [Rhodospirillaceae bacterium]MDE0619717.1 hypothetical protein [Rhodospirillaceae bacterium]
MSVPSTEDICVSLIKEAEKRLNEAKTDIEYASGNAQFNEREVRKATSAAKRRIAKAQELLNQVADRLQPTGS